MPKSLSPEQIQERLKRIGELLKTTPAKSTQYKRLMIELDRLLGTEEQPRDKEAEEEWERNK